MKKRIFQVMCLVMCLAIVCTLGIVNGENKIQIDDQEAPLVNGIGTLLTEQEEDINVIPDKYNTGAKGELIPVTSECYISGVKFGTTGVNDRKLDLYYQPKGIVIPSTIVVENYDFSSSDFREYSVDKIDKVVTVIYRNCKFKSYIIGGEGKIQRQFENCTFVHFAGYDATFSNCYFGGGSSGDGVNPMKNCNFKNCMIADLIQPVEMSGGQHIDGFQIFGNQNGGINENIKFVNCRFEVPYIPMSNPSGLLNCPVTMTMNYSDANNILFNDCYINGGQYYGLMLYTGEYNVTNFELKNIHIGANSASLYTCDSELEKMVSNNVFATSKLYVASVWKAEDGIHLSVTNDTLQERKLRVLTESGVKEIIIPACYKGRDLDVDVVEYADFPFDIEVVVPHAQWIVCFDSTNDVEQIRFVNWSEENVYINLDDALGINKGQKNEDLVFIPEIKNPVVDNGNMDEDVNITSGVTQSGECGIHINYVLENGILTLNGEGSTYNYHSGNRAPWYENKENITEIYVNEGITYLGNQLFADCKNVKKVQFLNGVETLGSNLFKGCNEIEYVYIPKTLKEVWERSFTGTVQRVEYAGTEDEWKNISFGAYNSGILSAEIDLVKEVAKGECGKNIEWSLTSDGKLMLYGEGSTYNYHSGNRAPWYENRKKITEVYVNEGIVFLGNQLFADCENIKKIHFANGVETLGSNMFKGCNAIEYVYIPKTMREVWERSFIGSVQIVEYAGTKDEWDLISIGEHNGGLISAEIIYEK